MSDFREFVNDTKHAYGELTVNLRGSRDPTPMVLFQSGDDVQMIAVEAAFFEDADRTVELVERFIVPLVREREPQRVAWAFAAERIEQIVQPSPGPELRSEVVAAVVMDRELHETWIAPLTRAPMTVGEWEVLPPNEQAGRLITPIQEALR